MKDSKILLLGGNGYLGTVLFSHLRSKGFTNIYAASPNYLGGYGFQVDLLSHNSISALASKRFDLVVNLTGQISRPISNCLQINTKGIFNLTAAVNPDTVLIQLSTLGVYGSADFADEDSECNPDTPYSTAKRAAEVILDESFAENKLLILRLSNIYGGNQPKGIFAYMKRSALSDRILNFNNDGSLVRYFLHVEDFAEALSLILENRIWENQRVINLAGKDRYDIKELIGLFEAHLGIFYHSKFESIKPYDNLMKVSDRRIRELTGFQEKFNLENYITNLSTW